MVQALLFGGIKVMFYVAVLFGFAFLINWLITSGGVI